MKTTKEELVKKGYKEILANDDLKIFQRKEEFRVLKGNDSWQIDKKVYEMIKRNG